MSGSSNTLNDPSRLVTLVPTGTANLASVIAAFTRLGFAHHIARAPQEILDAQRLVLPGVGAFAAAMDALTSHGLIQSIKDRLADGRPCLGICLGMQVLFSSSEESPGVQGLGLIDANISRIASTTVRVPHLGWSRVTPLNSQPTSMPLTEGFAYFAHSYRFAASPNTLSSLKAQGWNLALTDHGTPFIASLSRGSTLACQFHPELSSEYGMMLLKRWLDLPITTRQPMKQGVA